MYKPYGIHKKQWNEYKKKVENGVSSKDLDLDDKQKWFLFEKLLQGKFNHLYQRVKIDTVRKGLYVYCEDLGRGQILNIHDDLMIVKFDSKEFGVMCSIDSYTVHDRVKRKIMRI